MKSRLLEQLRQEKAESLRRMSPEQRRQAFQTHMQLLNEVFLAGQKLHEREIAAATTPTKLPEEAS